MTDAAVIAVTETPKTLTLRPHLKTMSLPLSREPQPISIDIRLDSWVIFLVLMIFDIGINHYNLKVPKGFNSYPIELSHSSETMAVFPRLSFLSHGIGMSTLQTVI